LPEAFCLIAGALKQAKFVLHGLEVEARAMRRNIDHTDGLVMSEALMMGLASHIGREYAHDLVYDLCRESTKRGVPLIDLAAKHSEIARRAALERMMDPSNYLGQAGPMIDRVLAAHA
jgi:3-carboxy-cis,cis-muconate cycloisomerase